jgi:hypothetical protein
MIKIPARVESDIDIWQEAVVLILYLAPQVILGMHGTKQKRTQKH